MHKRFKITLYLLSLSILLLLPVGTSFAATGDVLYQNCFQGGTCGGEVNDPTRFVRTVETIGCATGSCLKAVGLFNGSDYGSGAYAIGTGSAVVGQNEITAVYYTKFSESVRTISGCNIKAIRPYVGDSSKYFMATLTGFNLSGNVDFFSSFNYGTVEPTAIGTIRDYEDSYEGNGDACDDNGDGTYNCPAGRIPASFNQGGYNGFGTQWTKVRQWIKLPSTPTGSDGEAKIWVNDELLYHLYNSSIQSGAQSTFSGFTFYPSSEADEAFEHWMDEMVIYEGYVPPSGEPETPPNTSGLILPASNLKIL